MVLGQELISLCIPVMNRFADLRLTLPLTCLAAQQSMPVEIAVLDYNSSDGLEIYPWKYGANISHIRYEGREHYHMAHAWNLAVKSSAGEYIVVMGADAILGRQYIASLRELIADGCIWMRARKCKGIVCIKRTEFLAMGGYDERFEFYMGEDKEMEARLRRRGGKFGLVPDGLVGVIRTPASMKLKNYSGALSRAGMRKLGVEYRAENEAAGLLVANEGAEWGAR